MARLAMADVVVGTQLPAQSYAMSRETLVRYSGASGDFNPIHWSSSFAQSAGLPDVIAHGMLTMAESIRVVTDWTGDPGAVVDYGVRFTRPVIVPELGQVATIEVSGVVKEIRPNDGTVVVALTTTFQGQTVLTKARAVVRLA